MKPKFRSLFLPEGTISGQRFASLGAGLFILKYIIDFSLARFGFGMPWWPTDYFFPRQNRFLPGFDSTLSGYAMIAVAIPFVWIGVNLTLRRLRTLGWPAPLVALFFVPFLNLIFFAALSLKPNPGQPPAPPTRSVFESAGWLTIILTMGIVGIVSFATVLLGEYGWGLFVGAPFLSGFIPGLNFQRRDDVTFGACFRIMLTVQALIALCIFVINIEGAICILMAAPLRIVLGAIGVFIGFSMRKISNYGSARSEISAASFLILPLLIAGEARIPREPSVFRVSSEIEVNAPPERVWKSVIEFSELPPPTEAIFRAGLAYPIRAEIHGHGVGAERHCVFSTGPFIEPITVWNEPELLRFDVTKNPAPMKELSFAEIDPPHLHGFLVSKQGQFELLRLPDGKTRLIGTTWYQHGLWPEQYWRLWSDYIIHTIHLRVLVHIKAEAEAEAESRNSASASQNHHF